LGPETRRRESSGGAVLLRACAALVRSAEDITGGFKKVATAARCSRRRTLRRGSTQRATRSDRKTDLPGDAGGFPRRQSPIRIRPDREVGGSKRERLAIVAESDLEKGPLATGCAFAAGFELAPEIRRPRPAKPPWPFYGRIASDPPSGWQSRQAVGPCARVTDESFQRDVTRGASEALSSSTSARPECGPLPRRSTRPRRAERRARKA